MKLRKILIFVLFMFASVFALNLSVNAADGDVSFIISNDATGYNDGYTKTTGTTGSMTITSSNLTMNYTYSGINTKSNATADAFAYGYIMYLKNYGYIYSTEAINGYYPSEVTVTFSSGTGVSGYIMTSFSTEKMM